MARPVKLYGGRVIGAAALTMMFWGLPLVVYALNARFNAANPVAIHLASNWSLKNQSLLLALIAGLAAIALFHDYHQARRREWKVRNAISFGIAMGMVQWFNALVLGDHKEAWIFSTTVTSLLLFGMVVLTRFVAMEVERLESVRTVTP